MQARSACSLIRSGIYLAHDDVTGYVIQKHRKGQMLEFDVVESFGSNFRRAFIASVNACDAKLYSVVTFLDSTQSERLMTWAKQYVGE